MLASMLQALALLSLKLCKAEAKLRGSHDIDRATLDDAKSRHQCLQTDPPLRRTRDGGPALQSQQKPTR